MPLRKSVVIPALLAAAIPVSWALAQGGPPDGGRGPGARAPSPEVMSRLHEGRIAMAKTALKLNEAQLKLWAPVEEQMRASFTARQKTFEERRKGFEDRRAAREQQQGKQAQPEARPRPDMAENLNKLSERMTQRAERMKAFAAAYKPFYESLNEEQKQVAGIVLRRYAGGGPGMGHGMRGFHRRWAMEDGPMGGPRSEQSPR